MSEESRAFQQLSRIVTLWDLTGQYHDLIAISNQSRASRAQNFQKRRKQPKRKIAHKMRAVRPTSAKFLGVASGGGVLVVAGSVLW